MKNFIISVLSLSFLISCSSGVGGEDSIEPNNSINEQWTQTFGGADREYGHSVQQTQDGGYIITGSTSSFGNGDSDVYLIKTDSNGNELWTQTFGGIDREYGHSVQQTQDGGYIITGYYYNLESLGTNNNGNSVSQIFQDIYLIKTDGSGNEIWSKTFEGLGNDLGNSVQQTNDGGYIICGETESFGNGDWDVYLIKTDNNGDSLWTKTFGGSNDDVGQSIHQTNDGGYIITGSTQSFGNGGYDVWLIKTDENGDTLWTKTFGGSNWDFGYSVQQTTDGGYIITGSTLSFGNGGGDVYIIKTDGNGNVTSTFNIPTPSSNRKLDKVVDILGRETKPQTNTPFIEIYDDGSTEKKIVVE